ncbi:MAG: SAM-dependent methyltransferase [Pseudomonadota bacterium]
MNPVTGPAATGSRGDLTHAFARLIAADGPISVQRYMGEANARYYATRDPLGAGGDFVTAPEISQIFGELVGLWLADVWMRAGRPGPLRYVELGPGRATLARDVLRTFARFGMEPEVHFIEASPALRAIQLAAVPGAVIHDDLSTLPQAGPLLIAANEFLDALPIRQLVRTDSGWRERMIGLRDDSFVPMAGSQPMDSAVPPPRRSAPAGTIIETSPAAAAIVQELARRLTEQGGAALLIDYGYDAVCDGSTLQAVRAHEKVDPFNAPGEADLTAHVDFATLAEVARAAGARWSGTVGQGAWLQALGADARACALGAAAPEKAAEILAAKERLVAPEQMGTLFKVMGLAAPDWPDGAGF